MGQQINNELSKDLSKSKNAIENFKKSLIKAGKSSAEIDSIINKVKELNVQIDSLRFKESTDGIMNIDVSGIDNLGNKIKITQSLLQDLQTKKWNVSNTSTSVISTKEIERINNTFAEYTAKLEQFKSTNNNILSGLSAPLSDFENKLMELKNGTVSINEVKNSFRLLNAEVSKITSNLSGQLSKTDSAIRNIAKGEETISGLKAEFKGLSNVPKEINSELDKLSIGLQNIKKIESEEGRTTNWSAAYKEWENSVNSLIAKLHTLKKEQANSATTQVFNVSDLDKEGKIYVQKVSNTIAKTKSELESKLRNAGYMDIEIKGVEDANGKIKSLTASVTDATGAFKQLNFERAKIQNQGKAQSGFIQTNDVKVIGNISSSIVTVQNNLNSLKNRWEEQGILVGEFKTKVDQLESSLSSVGSKGELSGLKNQIDILNNEASTIAKINKIQFQLDTGGYESKIESLISRTRQWTDETGSAQINTDALSKAFDNLTASSNALSNNNTVENQKALIAAEKELDTQIKTVTNSVRRMNAELAKDSTIASLHQRIQEFYDKNGAAHRQRGTQLKQMLSETSSGATLTNQKVREIETSFIQVGNAARQAGKLGKSWFQTIREGMSSFSYWTSSTFLVMKAIQEIKKSVIFAKELDSALVNINYTMDVTSSQLENIGNKSIDMAKNLKTSAENVLGSVKLYANAKETADSILEKAQPAIMLSNVTGFSGEESAKYLQTIMNQFDLTQDHLMSISDTIQGVSQSMAHDFSKLIAA